MVSCFVCVSFFVVCVHPPSELAFLLSVSVGEECAVCVSVVHVQIVTPSPTKPQQCHTNLCIAHPKTANTTHGKRGVRVCECVCAHIFSQFSAQ